MTTTITPEQADTLPAEAGDLDALAPCPFCGGEAKKYHHDDGSGWRNTDWVCCQNDDCGCQTCLHETPGEAIAAWNRRADDHYFAVDYTGCIHEAPDRETAIKWAEDFARTANGGAIGSERPEVAAMIGMMDAPVAWTSQEHLDFVRHAGDRALGFGRMGSMYNKPNEEMGRTVPLYTHPVAPVTVKPLEWLVADRNTFGDATWWKATCKKTDLSYEVRVTSTGRTQIWRWRQGWSFYDGTADQAKAHLQGEYEANILSTLDTGEPK